MSATVLVVDDEQAILTLVEFHLKKSGYQVMTATDGNQAFQMVQAHQPDLVLLDVMLPGMDGFDVCRKMRASGLTMPVMMLTARDEEMDKVLGLELGADDYLTKPFSPRELVARVKALLRRSFSDRDEPGRATSIQVAGLKMDLERYEVHVDGKPVNLTPKEFEILHHLVQNHGKVVTREQLLAAVWNYDFLGDTRTVDVHVSHLREKLEEDPRQPRFIKTVRGLGYMFEGRAE